MNSNSYLVYTASNTANARAKLAKMNQKPGISLQKDGYWNVEGSNSFYQVHHLDTKLGHAFMCNCQAGQKGIACYHATAVLEYLEEVEAFLSEPVAKEVVAA